MSMMNWAEKEVEIACKKENPNRKKGEFDYGCACYESALKAYKSLMEDGHSGFSISITAEILNRLVKGQPLTPIEDVDGVWDETGINKSAGVKTYQCKRQLSLFKDVYPDGTVKYNDVDSYYCVNIDDPNVTYTSRLVSRILDEMMPITMPYMPGKPIKVYCEEFLTDWKCGDFDTVGVLSAIEPDGEKITIGRYFKEGENGFEEIDLAEYEERKAARIDRKEK